MLACGTVQVGATPTRAVGLAGAAGGALILKLPASEIQPPPLRTVTVWAPAGTPAKIGRASCRERAKAYGRSVPAVVVLTTMVAVGTVQVGATLTWAVG